MHRSALVEWMNAQNIRPDAYDLSGSSPNEAYVMRACGDGWEVFYSEHGLQTDHRSFDTETEAGEHLRKLIEADQTIRIR
jgi:hypothetical protein